MAMEYRQTIIDAHSKPILAIQHNPFRREIYSAGEGISDTHPLKLDSMIHVWEAETGKLLNKWSGHTGWITALIYCREVKMLFSCSIDGLVIAWGSNGKIIERVDVISSDLLLNRLEIQFIVLHSIPAIYN